ncbi:MAG: hypothetical protein ABR526_11375 [Chthoniobacterales bacterium]
MTTSPATLMGPAIPGLLMVIVAAVYSRQSARRWDIRWGYFVFAVLAVTVALQALITGRVATARHSATVLGGAAVVVAVLLVATAILAFRASVHRRGSSDDSGIRRTKGI